MKEQDFKPQSGAVALVAVFLALGLLVAGFVYAGTQNGGHPNKSLVFLCIALSVIWLISLLGFLVVQPNQGVILQLFGRYIGTAKVSGLWWANPFYSKRKLSLRVRNFETGHLKVNDHDGNPIEIAAVVVWKVVDTFDATFQVDNYDNYVHVQSEAALRNLSTAYPYDAHEEGQMSLRGNTIEIAEHLKSEIHDRLAIAGVETLEARISHLAYAPEIAAVMLQRQQASAIIAARQKIVEGACGMVEMALARLSEKQILDLDPERRAAMVGNLLVVLCGERAAQPVLNTGTLYQ
jgi:regulator of protease activity HflC (stomatin/prohibitin superfamily)